MRWKKSLASVALELATVLLVTLLSFAWGTQVAQTERGYTAFGGEYVLLLFPALYYIVKQMIKDWVADVKKRMPDTRR